MTMLSATGATIETQLANHDITFSGKLISPSCTVRLENSHLIFNHQQGDNTVLNRQLLMLNLSQCDIDSIGIMFKAEHWPDYPTRGIFRGAISKKRNDWWYYTIALGSDPKNSYPNPHRPLSLTTDSPRLESDSSSGDNIKEMYFNLASVNYWFNITTSLNTNNVLAIPFSVQINQVQSSETHQREQEDLLESHFTLQISWR
ncbi:hypothetical protein [Providencia sp. PROV117]|uniref:hypothetical protein n=1 Tax=Providencia sp. PROV117 TaxID=2949828 RepID=UPI002349FE05|nr:hypothetical protein [Providencia sp. PROV117]